MTELEASHPEAYIAKWDLTEVTPLTETQSSWLWRATAPAGPAVLKLIKPRADTEIPGAEMLKYWHGLGGARLFEAEDQAVLLEFLPGPSLGDLSREGRDGDATQAFVTVLQQLHRPRNFAPDGLSDLDQWLAPLVKGTHHGWPRHSGGDMLMAAGVARRLLASARNRIPLHGDLHHDNIRWSGTTWKAFDPKGLIGDPGFDAAMAFRNPAGADLLIRSYQRIEFLANSLSEGLGYSKARLLGWGAVQSALSLIWLREDGKDCAHDLALLPRLLAAYGAAPDPA